MNQFSTYYRLLAKRNRAKQKLQPPAAVQVNGVKSAFMLTDYSLSHSGMRQKWCHIRWHSLSFHSNADSDTDIQRDVLEQSEN